MPHSPVRLAWLLLLPAASAALSLAALSLAYRRTLVRGLRERHPALWSRLGARVGPFLRAGGHYELNDADLAAAGRLHLVTWRAAVGLGVLLLGLAAWLLLARPWR